MRRFLVFAARLAISLRYCRVDMPMPLCRKWRLLGNSLCPTADQHLRVAMLLIADLLPGVYRTLCHAMAEDIRIRFGVRLRQLRRRRGMTQVQLAERLGLDRSYLADIERGKRNVSIVNLEILAKGLGLTLSRLLSRL